MASDENLRGSELINHLPTPSATCVMSRVAAQCPALRSSGAPGSDRLAKEGIEHCFGVAGDYVFPICDAVDGSAKVKWIGCSNELNASYVADGYARIWGAAMLATTYGVGELSAINGIMGAKAERSLVFHVVGMPSYQNQRVRKIAHHTLGDGVFGNFVALSARAACCHAVIHPENCVVEMERVIAEARRNHQPAYIAVPSDYALSPVVSADVKPIVPRSNEAALQKAMAIIAERVNKAKSVVAFPAFTVSRLGCKSRHRRRSKRWAVLLSQRSWKNA
jgi:indolepyruvate decarboxylase